MTPDEARDLLDGTTPGPWEWRWDTGLISLFGAKGEPVATDLEVQDSDLAAAAPALAAMIAGMREEWVGKCPDRDGKWDTICTYPTREEVVRHLDYLSWDAYTHTRIVRRYVTTEEEIS